MILTDKNIIKQSKHKNQNETNSHSVKWIAQILNIEL